MLKVWAAVGSQVWPSVEAAEPTPDTEAREIEMSGAPGGTYVLVRAFKRLEARRRGGEAPLQNRMPTGAGIGIALGVPVYIMADKATRGYINRGVVL